ncbi:syntaxin-8 [Drosophila montana]|uniref:syntaxin-8 n=1 Tax=Drosophila montana TaxID=40370 RepID=UPI00313A8CC3
MSLVDHDSWDIEFEGCERLRHQILVLLNQRRQLDGTAAAPEYVRLTSSIEASLEQLRKDVSHLKVALDNDILWELRPAEELQRRRINYDKLASQLREADAKFTSSTRADQLPASSSSVWQNAAAAAPGRPQDVVGLRQQQEAILEHQNRGLEVLSATISRQRNLATQLGNEVEDQNNILDNLANTMDRVETGVQRETHSISQVNRRDTTWGYWLLIIALFVAIIVVVLL